MGKCYFQGDWFWNYYQISSIKKKKNNLPHYLKLHDWNVLQCIWVILFMSHLILCKHTWSTYSWHSGIHTKSNLTVTEHSPIVIWLEIPNELLTLKLNKDIHYDVCLHSPKHLIRIYMLWHGSFGSSGSICEVSNLPEMSVVFFILFCFFLLDWAISIH